MDATSAATAKATSKLHLTSAPSITSECPASSSEYFRLRDPQHFAYLSDKKECHPLARRYYSQQAVLLANYNEDNEHLSSLPLDGDRRSRIAERSRPCDRECVLEYVTIALNIILMSAKLTAVILSGSLSIISSLVDSAVDITTGVVIWLTNRAIRTRDPYKYPRGRTRLEPLALIVISIIMGVASISMIAKATEAMATNKVDFRIDWWTIGIMLFTIVAKFTLMTVCYCSGPRTPTISILAQDHRNDTISNSVAIICGYLGYKYWKYIDPIGAIVVSLYILTSWCVTGYKQISIISGRTASPAFISRIIKICLDHDQEIRQIDSVMVYHFGTQFIVEVDIVLDEMMTVRTAHDISEPLQYKIEQLPDVERAFVHVDFQTKHTSLIEHKSV